jgi:hypothetical protein
MKIPATWEEFATAFVLGIFLGARFANAGICPVTFVDTLGGAAPELPPLNSPDAVCNALESAWAAARVAPKPPEPRAPSVCVPAAVADIAEALSEMGKTIAFMAVALDQSRATR